MEAETSEKIWRALHSYVRTYVDENLFDNVYYGRQNYKGWHGSAKVLDKECLNLLIRFGGAFYRMYP